MTTQLPIPSLAADGSLLFNWLFLDLNSYFASVEQQEDPQLRGRPLMVVPVMTDFTCAIAASYEAKAFGIKTGTPVREAKFRCPQILIRLANPQTYVTYHHRILEEVDRHILVDHVASIDEMACQLTGKWRTAENAIALAKKIKAGIAANVGVCLTSSIGISSNQFLAKTASDMQKPDGLVLLHPSELPDRILHLVPRDLCGIGANMERRLQASQIRTMQQLWDCPPLQLRGIWGGVEGERFWYSLRGIEIPRATGQSRSLGHSHVLAPENRPIPMAENVGRRLFLKCATRLRSEHFLATAMSLSVRLEIGPRHGFDVRFPPMDDNLGLQNIFLNLWYQMVEIAVNQRLKKISVTFYGLIKADSQRQLELFSESRKTDVVSLTQSTVAQEKRDRLTAAMDQLNSRFGRDTVTLGMMPGAGGNFTGNKIAFTRVPKAADFNERVSGLRGQKKVKRKK